MIDTAACGELVRQAQSGGPAAQQAWERLWREYARAVYMLAYERTGDHYLAQDITSETFAKAIKAINTYVWRGYHLKGWLYRIARNLVAGHYRGKHHQREVLTTTAPDSAEASAEHQLIIRSDEQLIHRLLHQLTGKQRHVIELRFMHELPIADVQELMDCSEGTVKSLQARAVAALRRHLPEGYEK